MNQLDFTPRNIAKEVVRAVIAGKLADLAQNALTDNTPLDEDGRAADVIGMCIGWGISSMIKPHTDKAVDKTANFIAAKREARKEKKAQKEVRKED